MDKMAFLNMLVTQLKYQDPMNPLFRDVGKNYLKGRLRSHPDVARRHHADLLSAEELAKPAGPGGAY